MTDFDAPPGFISAQEVTERYSIKRGSLTHHDAELQPIKVKGRKYYALARLRAWAIKRRNALTKKGPK